MNTRSSGNLIKWQVKIILYARFQENTAVITAKSHQINGNSNAEGDVASTKGVITAKIKEPQLISRLTHPCSNETKVPEMIIPTPKVIVEEDDEEEEEEESSRDSAQTSKSSLSSPILSTPTTIRFPPRDPSKGRAQGSDIGFCRWHKCELNFDNSSALLEHLQVVKMLTLVKY